MIEPLPNPSNSIDSRSLWDWLPSTAAEGDLDHQVRQAVAEAARTGRLTAARHGAGFILAAPHQTESEVIAGREALQDLTDPDDAIIVLDVALLPWNLSFVSRQDHKNYRFERRIVSLKPQPEFLALTRDNELAAIATPAELSSEAGCAILQIQCFSDNRLDQVSYFFAFGRRSFCEAEGNPWVTVPRPSPLGEDIRHIIKHPGELTRSA